MGIYTASALASVVVVVLVELLWARTGIFRTPLFWMAMVIVLAFQIPVDGWLTKLSDPVVLYSEADMTGVRFPWDIPVEDFAFGFAVVTLTLVIWLRLGRAERPAHPDAEASAHPPADTAGTAGTAEDGAAEAPARPQERA